MTDTRRTAADELLQKIEECLFDTGKDRCECIEHILEYERAATQHERSQWTNRALETKATEHYRVSGDEA